MQRLSSLPIAWCTEEDQDRDQGSKIRNMDQVSSPLIAWCTEKDKDQDPEKETRILILYVNLEYVSSQKVCESGADVPQGRDDQDSYCSRILTLIIMIRSILMMMMIKKYFDDDHHEIVQLLMLMLI